MPGEHAEELSHAALIAIAAIALLALLAFVLAVLAVVQDALGFLPQGGLFLP